MSKTFFCSGHGTYLPRSRFYPASIKAGETRCKKCNGKWRQRCRNADPLHRLQWKMYRTEHRRGGTYPSLNTVRDIITRYDGCSALSGKDGDLTIVRYFLSLSLDAYPWNAVIVTTQEARRLPKNQDRRQLMFPVDVQERMLHEERLINM